MESSSKKELQPSSFAVGSDEDMEEEERRIMHTAKTLNKERKMRSKSKAKSKRARKE